MVCPHMLKMQNALSHGAQVIALYYLIEVNPIQIYVCYVLNQRPCFGMPIFRVRKWFLLSVGCQEKAHEIFVAELNISKLKTHLFI